MNIIGATKASTDNGILQTALATSERSLEPELLVEEAPGDLPVRSAGHKSQRQCSDRGTVQPCHGVPSCRGREAISSLLHHTPPSAALSPTGQAGLGPVAKGQRAVEFLGSWRTEPSALQLFKEVVPAGQALPRRLPVCVSAQTSIHFPKEDLLSKCN